MIPATALASSGASSISVSPSTVSIPAGSSSTISYSVKLVSGSTWGTSISATAPSGITVTFSDSSGDPPFSGTATIIVGKTVSPGTYTIQLSASGDDPSTSPTTVTVDVTNATVSPPSPPPVTPAVHVNYVPFVIGGLSIGLFIVFIVLFSVFFSGYAPIVRSASFIITAALALYLIIFDRILFTAAYYHWLGLVVYLVLSVAMFLMSLFGSTSMRRLSLYALAGGNTLLGLLMISDAVAGLPVSSLAGVTKNVGWNYLFGFGTTSISTISISLAFTLLLIFTGIYAGSSLASARSGKR
ncbi:hypothetical protein DMB44_02125 [Thermoplasma sp. Kam2015]|nr:hypothetical protein DMB44_02125 [Thermoplasma sp. Kam2015]